MKLSVVVNASICFSLARHARELLWSREVEKLHQCEFLGFACQYFPLCSWTTAQKKMVNARDFCECIEWRREVSCMTGNECVCHWIKHLGWRLYFWTWVTNDTMLHCPTQKKFQPVFSATLAEFSYQKLSTLLAIWTYCRCPVLSMYDRFHLPTSFDDTALKRRNWRTHIIFVSSRSI